MAYADSAIDYKWSITSISVEQGQMTVKYDPADSTDSARPSIFRNIGLTASEFNDSDIRAKAESFKQTVVIRWDQILEDVAANASFNADSYVGVENTDRYLPSTFDSVPPTNAFVNKIVESTTTDSYAIHHSYSVVAMTDSEKNDAYNTLSVDIPALWMCLESDGRLDSVVASLGADSASTFDANEVVFQKGSVLRFNDDLSTEIKSILGYTTDSDFAVFFSNISRKDYTFYG